MNISRRTLAWTLTALAIASGGCADKGMVGKDAPTFTNEFVLSANMKRGPQDFKGQVVLLDFWATWCGPCKQLMPSLESMYAHYRTKGFQLMAITAEERKDVEQAENLNPHSAPVYIDKFKQASSRYGVSAFPTTVVIDRNGKVIWWEEGFDETTPGRLEDTIRKALG